MYRTEWSRKTSRNRRGATLFGAARLIALVCCAGIFFAHAEPADRLLVAVNGSVITEGDLYVVRSLNEIVYPGRAVRTARMEEEIERRINLELILQELTNLRLKLEDEDLVRAKLAQIEQRYADSGGLSELLESIGISEEELYSFLKLETMIAKFLDFRFRPFVRIDRKEIEDYYRERLQPQLRASGIDIPPLEEVSKKIEEILLEEKINTELELWIDNARNNAKIEYFLDNALRSPDKVSDGG